MKRDRGDISWALTIYQQIIEQNENWAPVYYEIAWSYQLADNNEKAISAIEQAILFVEFPSEWYYLRAGAIYEWGGYETQAKEAYQNALTLNSSNVDAQLGLDRVEKK